MTATAPRLFEHAVTDAGELVVWQQPELEVVAPVPDRVVLIGCTKTKRTHPCAAEFLYDASHLYAGRRRYARATGHPWAILSALYGLVEPSRMLEPYDYSIDDRRRDGAGWSWAAGVIQAAHRLAGIGTSVKPGEQFATYDRELVLEVHAGKPYVELLEAALERSFRNVTLEHPVAGMQIGEQLRHYKEVVRSS